MIYAPINISDLKIKSAIMEHKFKSLAFHLCISFYSDDWSFFIFQTRLTFTFPLNLDLQLLFLLLVSVCKEKQSSLVIFNQTPV